MYSVQLHRHFDDMRIVKPLGELATSVSYTATNKDAAPRGRALAHQCPCTSPVVGTTNFELWSLAILAIDAAERVSTRTIRGGELATAVTLAAVRLSASSNRDGLRHFASTRVLPSRGPIEELLMLNCGQSGSRSAASAAAAACRSE